jgi:hypothetical protein
METAAFKHGKQKNPWNSDKWSFSLEGAIIKFIYYPDVKCLSTQNPYFRKS